MLPKNYELYMYSIFTIYISSCALGLFVFVYNLQKQRVYRHCMLLVIVAIPIQYLCFIMIVMIDNNRL